MPDAVLARLSACQDLLDAGARGVHGDLSDQDEVRGIAEQVNRLGQPDSVIHNAGVLDGPVLSVNVVAPYLLRPEKVRACRTLNRLVTRENGLKPLG